MIRQGLASTFTGFVFALHCHQEHACWILTDVRLIKRRCAGADWAHCEA